MKLQTKRDVFMTTLDRFKVTRNFTPTKRNNYKYRTPPLINIAYIHVQIIQGTYTYDDGGQLVRCRRQRYINVDIHYDNFSLPRIKPLEMIFLRRHGAKINTPQVRIIP